MKVLCITGAPGSGKSKLAADWGELLGWKVRSTDEVMGLEWSAASLEVSRWISTGDKLIIEGCTVPRALRKVPAGPILSEVGLIILPIRSPLIGGRRRMANTVYTVTDKCLEDWRFWKCQIMDFR